MEKTKVKVYQTDATSWYSEVAYYIKEIYEKYGDRLIDWKIASRDGELVVFYVLKDISEPEEKQIKI